jgi:hypothetical protein
LLGVYDFCGHYEWTFAWLAQRGGTTLLHEYWDKAIHRDSQRHAAELILSKGIEGMKEYWGHSLVQEAAGFHTAATETVFRIDIHECSSKGFLLRNSLEQYPDYCDHCVGWIGPLLKQAGFVVDHEHNHQGQCWWEMRLREDGSAPSTTGAMAGRRDVRLLPDWRLSTTLVDAFRRANGPEAKTKPGAGKTGTPQ